MNQTAVFYTDEQTETLQFQLLTTREIRILCKRLLLEPYKKFILDVTENDVMGLFLLLTGFLIAITSPVS